MIGGFGSAFILYGMALTYGATGTTLLGDIAQSTTQANPLLILGITLMGAGFAFKISAAPFHQWTPDVYQGAPMPVTGFMSVGTKAAAFAMIIRVFSSGLPHLSPQWQGLLAFAAVASLVVGSLLAIVQVSVKRLLAYSSIAQAGYILIGVLAGGPAGLGAVLFYLVAYLLMNLGAFALLTAFSGPGGDIDRMSDLDGLGRRYPVRGVLMTIFMLSLAGFPTTAGFAGKLFLFVAGASSGYLWLVIVAGLASAVSFYYYVRILIHVWSPKPSEAIRDCPRSPATTALIAALAVATIVLGILPALLLLGATGATTVVAAP
jgi:NADH-quinone oxidoreductase subunit N